MTGANPKNNLCGISVNKLHPTLMALGARGVTQKHFAKLRSDEVFANGVANFIKSGGVAPAIGQKRARDIMGQNFFGVEEGIEHLGVNPTRRHLALLSQIPFKEEKLERDKETHVPTAVFPLSILEMRERFPDLFRDQDWYKREEELFARQAEVNWHLICKTPVKGSANKNWQEQLALVGEEDEVPTAQVVVYTIIGHFLATGERLFKDIYVRTSSLDSNGYRVSVGGFHSGALGIYVCWDSDHCDFLALASARKS